MCNACGHVRFKWDIFLKKKTTHISASSSPITIKLFTEYCRYNLGVNQTIKIVGDSMSAIVGIFPQSRGPESLSL